MSKKFNLKIEGTIGQWPATKRNVSVAVEENSGRPMSVRMSSLGGSLIDGLGMMNSFKDHGDVPVTCTNLMPAQRTIAAMGGEARYDRQELYVLIHKCSNFVLEWGSMNADENAGSCNSSIGEPKRITTKIDEVMVAIYVAKTNLSADKIIALMKREAWLTAQEALTLGFADGFIEDESEASGTSQKTASISKSQVEIFNSYGVKLPPLPVESPDPFTAFTEKFLSLFKPNKESEGEKPKITMSKEFKEVSAILEKEALELTDGKLNLTEADLQKINASIEASKQSNTDKDTKIEELKAQVEALKGKPGAKTTVVDPLDGEGKENNVLTRLETCLLQSQICKNYAISKAPTITPDELQNVCCKVSKGS